MMNTFLSIAVCLLWLTVVNHAKMVLQSPDDLMKNQNELAVFTCSHNIQDYNRMLWYKQSHMSGLTLMGYLNFENENIEPEFENKIKLEGNAKKSGNLTIKNLRLDDSAVYFCAAWTGNTQAYFGSGTKLTVLDPKIKVSEEQDLNVTIIKPSEKESCKKTVTLVCVAKDFYPDHVSITWMVGGKPRTEGVATDPNAFREQETEHFTISSRLKVPRKEWNNEKTEFKCTLKFYDGKDYLYKENKVNGIAGSGYTREDYVKSSQMIKLSYGVFIAKSALYGLVIFVYVWRKGSGK